MIAWPMSLIWIGRDLDAKPFKVWNSKTYDFEVDGEPFRLVMETEQDSTRERMTVFPVEDLSSRKPSGGV